MICVNLQTFYQFYDDGSFLNNISISQLFLFQIFSEICNDESSLAKYSKIDLGNNKCDLIFFSKSCTKIYFL